MCKAKIKKLKEKWKFYPIWRNMLKTCFFVSFLEIISIIILDITNLLKLKPEDLKWFLSASAQSMAALLGLIGMFIIFKVEIINNRLNNCYDRLRKKFKSSNRGIIEADSWGNDEIVGKVKVYLNLLTEIPDDIRNDIECSIAEINSLNKSKEGIVKEFKNPLLFIVSSLLISLFLIPFSEFIFKLNLLFLILFLPFISITIIMIYFYFKSILFLAKL